MIVYKNALVSDSYLYLNVGGVNHLRGNPVQLVSSAVLA